MNTHHLPDTRRGRAYRKMLVVFYVVSIAGITLTVREIAVRLMDSGLDASRLQAGFLGFTAVQLAAWGLICRIGYRGSRRSLAPPAWAYAAVTLLSWAAILLNRLGGS
ncbi:hypothetical protein [Longimicrobium sp.]|uniref:hypothetical protein n=1 Tax=Longimicrobium sp. TaxID=2029185 RepID=UPI002BAD332E|nr:hypothetical protein [Longimicrobium sp.]HSU14816.1 hypothetical protein [Longimicrobium sp.]